MLTDIVELFFRMIWLKLLVLLVVVTWQVECRPIEFGREASATTPKIFGVGLNPMSTVAQILRDMDLNVLFDSGIIVPSYDPWDAVVSKLDGISFDDWEGAVSIGGLRYPFPPILKAYPAALFITLWREPSDWLNAIVGFQVPFSESDRYVWVDYYNRYYNTLWNKFPKSNYWYYTLIITAKCWRILEHGMEHVTIVDVATIVWAFAPVSNVSTKPEWNVFASNHNCNLIPLTTRFKP